jgi:hypothetical protein
MGHNNTPQQDDSLKGISPGITHLKNLPLNTCVLPKELLPLAKTFRKLNSN